MLGRSRDSVVGKSIWELYSYFLESPICAIFHEAMVSGKTTSVEIHSPNSGRWDDVSAYPSADGLSVFFRDVTEPRRLTEELRTSEERYRTLVEQLPVVVYGLAPDVAQTLLYISPQIESLAGYSPDEALDIGRHWLNWIHPDDHARVVDIDNAADTSFRVEYRMLR